MVMDGDAITVTLHHSHALAVNNKKAAGINQRLYLPIKVALCCLDLLIIHPPDLLR
jgi:hypothetical protein